MVAKLLDPSLIYNSFKSQKCTDVRFKAMVSNLCGLQAHITCNGKSVDFTSEQFSSRVSGHMMSVQV